jgi:hypothetical protein
LIAQMLGGSDGSNPSEPRSTASSAPSAPPWPASATARSSAQNGRTPKMWCCSACRWIASRRGNSSALALGAKRVSALARSQCQISSL